MYNVTFFKEHGSFTKSDCILCQKKKSQQISQDKFILGIVCKHSKIKLDINNNNNKRTFSNIYKWRQILKITYESNEKQQRREFRNILKYGAQETKIQKYLKECHRCDLIIRTIQQANKQYVIFILASHMVSWRQKWTDGVSHISAARFVLYKFSLG